MSKENNEISNLFRNTVEHLVEKYVPIWGDILAVLNKNISDNKLNEINTRLEPLEKKLAKIKKSDLKKLEDLSGENALLMKADLYNLLDAYFKAALEKRREYLANAIFNIVTLKNFDYQQNSFFTLTLNNTPDISIEFLQLWYNTFREDGRKKIPNKEFEKLQKKYRSNIEQYEVILSCVSNGLLLSYEDSTRINMNDDQDYGWKITELGENLLKFISEKK